MVAYLDLKNINLKHKNELEAALAKVMESGWYILGKSLTEFENEYAVFNSCKHAIGVANGLDALILSLKVLDIGEGDEVIVPSNTYIASWLAVSYVGAKPVPVEPLWETCNINPALLESAITKKTKAIMPVNLYGQAAELDKIKAICDKHSLYLLEDNAQAQGAICNGKPAGSWGHINGSSFYPGKNLGALGDAGAITCDSDELAEKVRVLRNYGSQKKYYNEIKGVNSRLDELQAAFLSVKLKYLKEENKERQRLADLYNSALQNTGDITLPQLAENCSSVYHIYQIRTDRRDQLQKHLNDAGIGTMIHYPLPPHLQTAYSEMQYKKGDFPIAERIADTTLSIPLYPGMNENQLDEVVSAIKSFYNG